MFPLPIPCVFPTQQYGSVPGTQSVILVYVFYQYHCFSLWTSIWLSTVKPSSIAHNETWKNIQCGYLWTILTVLNIFLILLSKVFSIHLFYHQHVCPFLSVIFFLFLIGFIIPLLYLQVIFISVVPHNFLSLYSNTDSLLMGVFIGACNITPPFICVDESNYTSLHVVK